MIVWGRRIMTLYKYRAWIVLPFLLAGCSFHSEEILRTVSPDHAAVASLIEKTGGGAAVSAEYDLYLSSPGEGRADRVFWASYCCGITLVWRGDKTLLLTYFPGCHIRDFQNMWWDKRDIENAKGPTVEIILVRRRVPINRITRSGRYASATNARSLATFMRF